MASKRKSLLLLPEVDMDFDAAFIISRFFFQLRG